MEMNEKEEIKATTKKSKSVDDPWSVKEKIKVPRALNGEENFIIASLNGRSFKIKRGVEVEVPRPIAEIIQTSFEYQDKADELISSLVEN